ncbi:MAG: hypothetical protein IJP70_06840 [Bacteroidales bacterium]|nr:hypothetical protein [Bacteroidales bacterium]
MRRILLLLAVLWPLTLCADTPERIARLLESLPCKPGATDTLMRCPSLGKNITISVEHDKQGNLNHLGVGLFTPEMKTMSNRTLCNCVERIMLELLVQPTDKARLTFIKENRLKVLLDGFPLGSAHFPAFSKSLALVDEQSKTSMVENEDGYMFYLTDQDETTLTLAFPKDRELIFGTDKKEEDERVTMRLALGSTGRLQPKLPEQNKLKGTTDKNLWKVNGNPFMIDLMRSDSYYTKNAAGQVSVLFNADYPLQSFTNLLLGLVAQPDFKVDLTHKRYGLVPPRFDVDWGSLFNTLVDKDVECYAAARLIDEGKTLSGVLVMSHKRYGYINMLTVNAECKTLFSDSNPMLKAYLFTHVPQNNILNLFE